jgi:hypothetical protein
MLTPMQQLQQSLQECRSYKALGWRMERLYAVRRALLWRKSVNSIRRAAGRHAQRGVLSHV